MSWWDIAEIVVPVAASIVGTPAAGIAVSAAMKGGKAAAEGKGWQGILGQAALGAGTGAVGALGAGAAGKAISGAAEKSAAKVGEKAVEGLAKEAISKGGLTIGSMGVPQIAWGAAGEGAIKGATDTISKAGTGALSKLATKTGETLQKATGDAKSQGMLKTVKSGMGVVNSGVDFANSMRPEAPRFSQQHADIVGGAGAPPGMRDDYQFGAGTRTVGYGGPSTVRFSSSQRRYY